MIFPFGHGLSYTTFELTNLKLTERAESILISVEVANTGKIDGSQVVQVYVAPESPPVPRPVKELRGFKKVQVPARQRETDTMELAIKTATSYWDEIRNMWISAKGEYTILVGDSSANTPLSGKFRVQKDTWWKGL